jgi:hypothetical protein
MIHECSPKDTLANIQNFAPTKLPDSLTFYLEAKRLPQNTPLRTLPKSRDRVIIIYTQCQSVEDYSARQLK